MKETEKKNPNKTPDKWGSRPEAEKSKKQAAEAPSLEDWEGGGSRPQQTPSFTKPRGLNENEDSA